MDKKPLPWSGPKPRYPEEIQPDLWFDLKSNRNTRYFVRVLIYTSTRRLRKAYAQIKRVGMDKDKKKIVYPGAPDAAVFPHDFFFPGQIPEEMVGVMIITKKGLLVPDIYAHELCHVVIAHEMHIFHEGCLDYSNLQREEDFSYLYGDYAKAYLKWATKLQ